MPIPAEISKLMPIRSLEPIVQEYTPDFYAPDGFPVNADAKAVVLEWLKYAGQIYFNDKLLSEVVFEVRVERLLVTITSFITNHGNPALRRQTWNLFTEKMLAPAAVNLPDRDKCRKILAKLDGFNLDNLSLAENTVQNEATNAAYVLLKKELQHSVINFLTPTDVDLVEHFEVVIRFRLSEDTLPMELVQNLIKYAYLEGMFLALDKAYQENLPSTYHLDSLKDWPKAQVKFHTVAFHNKIYVTVTKPISAINGYASIDEEKSDKAVELAANLLVSQLTVAINPETPLVSFTEAKCYSYDTQVLKLIQTKWDQKIKNLSDYANDYAVNKKYDPAKLRVILTNYPELKPTPSYCYATFQLFSSAHEEMNHKAVLAYLGRNSSPYVQSQIHLIGSYAFEGVDSFIFAIKFYSELNQTELAAQIMNSYFTHAKLTHLTLAEKMREPRIRQAYDFLAGHSVYVIFRLFPEMKFKNATVLVQEDPVQLLQYDLHGKKRVLEMGTDLKNQIPLCRQAYLDNTIYRYAGVVDRIKLTPAQYVELNAVVTQQGGSNLNDYPCKFDYPTIPDEQNENIFNSDKLVMSMRL